MISELWNNIRWYTVRRYQTSLLFKLKTGVFFPTHYCGQQILKTATVLKVQTCVRMCVRLRLRIVTQALRTRTFERRKACER